MEHKDIKDSFASLHLCVSGRRDCFFKTAQSSFPAAILVAPRRTQGSIFLQLVRREVGEANFVGVECSTRLDAAWSREEGPRTLASRRWARTMAG